MIRNLENWRMNYREYKDIECRVPCSMYSVLLENGLIENPFVGMNDRKLTGYSDYPTEFVCQFDCTEEEYKHEYIELTFFGLDTICDIRLNGIRLGKTMDMHIQYSYNIKDYLKIGNNILTLQFSSPTEYFNDMHKRHHLFTNNEMNGDTIDGGGHLRKAFCMSGWDWAPKLPDMGIFRKVQFNCYNNAKIEDYFIAQKHYENCVELHISVETKGNYDAAVLYFEDKKYEVIDQEATIRVENPKLWWPNGLGEQTLYNIRLEIIKDGNVIDSSEKRIGLRTIQVSTEPDGDGNEFCFVINGHKIFAKGANYVPQDSIITRVTAERTRKVLEAAIDANYNSLRVWGGGYYPDDWFYDLCDEMGIILWQDFMVACHDIWLRDEFEELFVKEAIQNVKRIRHHASLGLLCGNNEVEERIAVMYKDINIVRTDYIRLYEHILPEICLKYAPQTFYWPSSPSCGTGENPTAHHKGDAHFWNVWFCGEPFINYRKYKFRFCSEFGFESFPSLKTIRTFCDQESLNPCSEIIENHQKSKGGNGRIITYMTDEYLYPNDFETLIYASQLVQADAIRYGVEHFRRIRGYCMGSIYWQFNDCWPGASWSSVDYYGRYKALHYAAKKFYAPVLMSLFYEKDSVAINVSNEKLSSLTGTVKFGVYDNDLNELMSGKCDCFVAGLSTKDIIVKDVCEYNKRQDVFFKAELYDQDGNMIMCQTVIFTKPKFYKWKKPNVTTEIQHNGENIEILVSADGFAKSVEIDFSDCDVILSDNFVDITSKDKVRITVQSDADIEVLKKSLKIKSVYDIK